MRYLAIRDHADRYCIRLMCRALQVSPAGYYAWRGRVESARVRDNRRLLVQIRACHSRSQCNYGSPRITRDLWASGERCSENRVARLMRTHGIQSKRRRRWRATTNSKHSWPVASNTLDRGFQVRAANQVWASDITYLHTEEGCCTWRW